MHRNLLNWSLKGYAVEDKVQRIFVTLAQMDDLEHVIDYATNCSSERKCLIMKLAAKWHHTIISFEFSVRFDEFLWSNPVIMYTDDPMVK